MPNQAEPTAGSTERMGVEFLPQARWSGRTEEIATAWTLQKRGLEARCTIVTHPLGHELRLFCGQELIRTQVFRRGSNLIDEAVEWRKAMLTKGVDRSRCHFRTGLRLGEM